MSNVGKKASESAVETTQIILPSHANPLGTVFGGQVAAWIDLCAGVAAMRHARQVAVTASMDDLHFLAPAYVGEVLVLQAQVNRAFGSSMEVGVKVESENPLTGERRHTATAYLTFVALDKHGNKVPVPPLEPETDAQQRRYLEAEQRRKWRLERRQRRIDCCDD
ncbi:MAG: acyl-CoA thioesterase [Chloroflexota bacterium]|nr:acyl-CoA thioesterase [Chloroflexota bacterium]